MSTETIANKYKVVREIARSNDVVYEVVDTTLGRRMALKELMLPQNLTGQARRERIERFNREARAAGKLSHPNIVTVYEYGEFNGRHYIAMEYLEGGTLRDILQARGALPLQEALDIASQVLNGLSHAHSRNVIHRDVKPDNIHIIPGGTVKLTDFGIARLTEEASLTGEGQVFGTPSYMSPEQIEGRFVDHRSDLFSLGIVLYEMAAGRKPFTGDSVVSITYSIMHNDPQPLAGIPYGVEQAVFRAIAKDPGRRFNSADEMRMALRNADAVPAMFLPPQPAQSRTYGGYPGGAYSGIGYLPPSNLPQPLNPGAPMPANAPPMGAPTYNQPPTAYSPPPVPAPPAQTSSNPFVNWDPKTQPPPPLPASALPRPPQGPIIGEGTRSFFTGLFVALFLSGLTLGCVLLFLRAYDQQRKLGPERAAAQAVAQGVELYDKGDLTSAMEQFRAAMKMAPGTLPATNARKNLAVALNRAGTRSFERSDYRAAENYWMQALDVDPENADVHYNLGKLYDRIGDPVRAAHQWQISANGGRIGDPNPANPGSPTALQARYERARLNYNEGMRLHESGDTDGARKAWQRAISEAPGTDVALEAQRRITETTSPPNF